MLITCLECGQEVSDKAKSCPHCGCPIEKERKENDKQIKYVYMCMSQECSNPFKEFEDFTTETRVCPDCGNILEYYETIIINKKTGLVEDRFENKTLSKPTQTQSNTPRCPTCGSTNVEKISVGKKVVGGAMFGLFSSNVRKTMCCKNCGYKW